MNRLIRHLAVILPAASILLVVACQSDPIKAPPGGQRDLLPADQYPRVVAIEGLASALRFDQPIVDPSTATRPLAVNVGVRSIEDKYGLNIQYRFEFFDADGRVLEPDTGWRFEHLEPRVMAYVKGNALNTKAADWRLVLRPAR